MNSHTLTQNTEQWLTCTCIIISFPPANTILNSHATWEITFCLGQTGCCQ